MPLQNRVDPFGQIHAVPARGLFTGNRGSIHDPETKTLLKRRWTTKAWIICDCGFQGRKREVFGRNTRGGGPGWTNLFFLDEVTALAAGHRPCFECRREKAKGFADCFGKAFGIAKSRVIEMDNRLHAERLAVAGNVSREVDRAIIAQLPDGAMIAVSGKPYALRHGRTLAWSFDGYSEGTAAAELTAASLVTPPTIIAVLQAGYQPVWKDVT
ncbi:MAG: hypothetical protein AB7P20_25565 [Rhizobiaceae bacterium]